MNLNPQKPCGGPRQSGGSTQIPSLTGYGPKSVEFKDIDTEAIEPEDLEPIKIELDRDLGTDPYQIQERFTRNSPTEDMDEFGKVGADTSYLRSQMHHDYDSAESIADSDLEDGELRKMMASPLYLQSRENYESSRMPSAPGKPAAEFYFQETLTRQILEDLFLNAIKIICSVYQSLNLRDRNIKLDLSIIASVSHSNMLTLKDWNYKTLNTDTLNLDENKYVYKKNYL